MKKIVILLVILIQGALPRAQQTAAVDSIKAELAKAVTAEAKVYWLDNLSRTLMNVNLQQAEEYGKQLIAVAEESRDRKLMIEAYMSNGVRCSYFAGQKDYTMRSVDFYNKALDIARQNKMEEKIGGIQLRLSAIHLAIPDKDKALNYVNQAFSLISTLNNDSLRAESHNSFGHVYLSRNEKTLALRHYLNALRLAEDLKKETSRHELMRNCYLYLSSFYSGIEDYDKAIDYHTLAYKKLDHIKSKQVPYQRAIDINSQGNLFAQKKNYDIAISYFERSIAMADSLKFPTLKLPGYISLLNQYLRMEQPQKALDYINSASGKALKSYLINFGFSGVIDQAYGVIYGELGQYDSARLYFGKAMPYFEQGANENNKIGFYRQLAGLYKRTGENTKAIEYYLKVKELAEKNGLLENAEGAVKNLDSLYNRTGDYQLASRYNGLYYQYKDSIGKLNKEKELAQVEATDEQYHQQKLEEEKAEKKRQKNNIQYMAITIGIAALFITLVVFGMFKVSAKTIRLIGFFAFIMFFEFIFLIFKKNIYSVTEGEPWKDLAFMIALAALLVPLHHWLEHKVIKYLTSHNRLTASGRTLLSKVFSRKTSDEGSKP
ncbi:MAG: tetratricopeptide repeat protein [Chitinophagaceae bacterium]|nr:tetratricopeptide repeat protein [Chitinophagaceae bacterium]